MVKSRLFFVGMLFSAAVLVTSCASFPQAEYDATKAAVSEVKTVGADVYVPEAFKSLNDSLQSAELKLNDEKAKWFKTYKDSKKSLASVTNFAAEVKAKTEFRKAELVKENQALVTEINGLIATNVELLKGAPKGKGDAEILVAIKTDISVVQTSVTEASGLNTSGDLLGANGKLKAAKEKALTIKSELETAIEKAKLRKKAHKTVHKNQHQSVHSAIHHIAPKAWRRIVAK